MHAARSRGRLEPGDRVVLAAAKLSQPLLDLRDAFRRVRDGGTFTPREEAAIARLRSDAEADEWIDVFDRITRIAVIVELDCATELDPGFREAAVLLEATAVSALASQGRSPQRTWLPRMSSKTSSRRRREDRRPLRRPPTLA